jgi:hypothetical protein
MSLASLEIDPIIVNRTGPSRSPFERTLLPEFAQWFADRAAAYGPDIFVPVETKGTRLLEAVVLHAQNALDTPLQIPVLYTPALAFLDPATLATKRLMLLDDAAHTGHTLERHRERVYRYGARDVDMSVCIATDKYDLNDIHPFHRVDDARYREYLFQLAELVVARGLPPEVDHHVFTLTTSGPLIDNWADLITRLSHFGELSLDGPLTTSADIESITLHFPELPGMPSYPVTGPARDERAKKLRLFLDSSRGVIHVVPIAFSALDLPAGEDPHALALETCQEIVERWTKGRKTVADLLLERAQTRDAELLFRTLSTATEVDLVCGLARLLGTALPDHTISLAGDRELFARLYGPEVGEAVAERVDHSIAAAFADGHSEAVRSTGYPLKRTDPQIWSVDASVVATTREIANYLKSHFAAQSKMPGYDPLARVGLSFTELGRRVPPEGTDGLMLSRCMDYGLARTTLVPFTDVEVRDDGQSRVRRKYRVAEASRADQDYEDVETMRREAAEELVALTAHVISRHTAIWPDGAVPYEIVARVVAILRAVLPNVNGSLEVVYSPTGPEVMFGEPANRKSVYSISSRHFRLDGCDICPTEQFAELYDADQLRLDERGEGTLEIESYLRAIASLLASSDDVAGELLAWSTIAQPKMGLDVVEHHLRRATDEMLEPLNVMLRGDRPAGSAVAAAVTYARELIGAAEATIDLLDNRIARRARATWHAPGRVESQLLRVAVAPAEPPELIDLARQTCASIAAAATQLELLAAPHDPVKIPESSSREVARQVIDAMVEQERMLTTLAADAPAPHTVDGDLTRQAAKTIERILRLVRLRAAAQAGIYRGVPRRASSDRGLSALRRSTVLVADLSGSTVRSMQHSHGETVHWSNDGLNLIALWGRAFGGLEAGPREGDAVRLEFRDADRAILCAAVVQRHLGVLRAIGRGVVAWECRMAIDTGELSDGDGANVLGRCLNVASKLVEFQRDDPDAAQRVLVTPSAQESCSALLRDGLLELVDGEFVLPPDYTARIDDAGMRFTPYRLDSGRAVQALLREAETLGSVDASI